MPLAVPFTLTRRTAPRRLFAATAALLLLSTGCSTAEDESSPQSLDGLQKVSSGGTERIYYVDLPETYDSDAEPLPLVVALHGTGGSHSRWLDDSYNLAEAVQDDAIMVYPEALPSAAGTNQWVIDRDLPFFGDLLDRLERDLTFDTDRVLVTGQSSGAGMSHEIGCAFGDRVRAIAPHAGVLTGTECTGAVAVIQLQGTSDPVVPYALAQQTSQFWSRYNGLGANATAPASHPSCKQYPGTDGTVDASNPHPVHLCLHNEGAGEGREGHAWPSIAGQALWDTFTALPAATNSAAAPAGGGNEKALAEADTTATFTLKFPDTFPSTPTQGAVVVYGSGDVTPTTAPLAFMTMQFAPGSVLPGDERTYTVPVTYAEFGSSGGFTMPGEFTVMVTMHTEDGGYPIPVPEMDLWSMTTHAFTGKEDAVVIDEVLHLEPIAAGTGL